MQKKNEKLKIVIMDKSPKNIQKICNFLFVFCLKKYQTLMKNLIISIQNLIESSNQWKCHYFIDFLFKSILLNILFVTKLSMNKKMKTFQFRKPKAPIDIQYGSKIRCRKIAKCLKQLEEELRSVNFFYCDRYIYNKIPP